MTANHSKWPPLLALALAAALAGGKAQAEPQPQPQQPAASPPPAGHVTGFGGLFMAGKDPKALMAWYRDVLGLRLEGWGGALLPYDAPGHPPAVVLNALPATSPYLSPSPRPFMLNFAVDDLDAMLARLKAHGVAVLAVDASDPSGRFAWLLDPEGTKIELWQPRAK